MYELIIKPTAQRQISRLDPSVTRRVIERLQQLGQDPRPPGVRKLHNVPHGYRIRVGDWRILYTINDEAKEVHIYRVRHRAKAYRR